MKQQIKECVCLADDEQTWKAKVQSFSKKAPIVQRFRSVWPDRRMWVEEQKRSLFEYAGDGNIHMVEVRSQGCSVMLTAEA